MFTTSKPSNALSMEQTIVAKEAAESSKGSRQSQKDLSSTINKSQRGVVHLRNNSTPKVVQEKDSVSLHQVASEVVVAPNALTATISLNKTKRSVQDRNMNE